MPPLAVRARISGDHALLARKWATSLLIGLAACAPERWTPGQEDSAGAPDSGALGGEAGVGLLPSRIEDAEFAELGYAVTRYEVGPDYIPALRSPDGQPAHFLVAAPVQADPGVSHPLVMMLHGGCMDVDSEADPTGADDTCGTAYGRDAAVEFLLSSDVARLFAERGALIVVPENAACDAWVGLGAPDPVDPLHMGFALADLAFDHVRHQQTTWGVDEAALHLIGTSLGAQGAVWFARRVEGIDSLTFDSGSGDLVRYYEEPDYIDQDLETRKRRLDHVLGGSPHEEATGAASPWFDRYEALSLSLALSAGAWAIPTFQVWNTPDPLSGPIPNAPLRDALAASGLRHAEWDLNHPLPIHGQVTHSPLTPVIWAAVRFAEGADITHIEAEDPTSTSTVGVIVSADPRTERASGDSLRLAGPTDGPGTLLDLPLPAQPSGAALEVSLWGGAEGAEGAGTTDEGVTVATLRLLGASGTLAEAPVTLADLQAARAGTYAARRASLEALTLRATADAGPLRLQLDVTGAVTVWADVATITR
jgi:hypothetical protein